MRDARQVIWGIITALTSIALFLGVFSISLAEANMQQPTPTLTLGIITPTFSPSSSLIVSPTPKTITLAPTQTPTRTATLLPTPSNCPPPAGWLPYVVQPGDTLDGLALMYKKTSLEISHANCLGIISLAPGKVLYLPPTPTLTPSRTRTSVPCGAPATWVIYIVQPGDTLYRLGQAYGIPYMDIQRANCLTSTTLRVGQRLYVPSWATRTPSPTFPGVPTWTLFSDTPVETPTETATVETSTPVDTDTPAPTPTPTTETPTP